MPHAEDILDMFDDLLDVSGGSVSYSRGTITATLDAVKGQRGTDRLGQDQNYGTANLNDFIFRVADLRANGFDPPTRRDRIVWSDHLGVARNFKVAEIDGSEDSFDDVGQHGVLYRVHTVEYTP